jgi:serine/threonine protein kinase
MEKKLACPSAGTLSELIQGRLAEPDLSLLSDHLETCPACVERAKTLTPPDTLLDMLREPAPEEDEFAHRVPRPLVERLKLIAGKELDTSRTMSIPTTSGHDASLTDFLAPAQTQEELGRLGKYRILKILGHGGMGVVYLAEDPKLKRHVAIKAMLPALAASASCSQRFLREAEMMAKVKHDNVVSVHDVVEERGIPFVVMELLQGESLDARLKREKKTPLTDLLRIGCEIAEGLAAANANGLIHRDIKPSNIWLEAPRARVRILDFGLARAGSPEGGLTPQRAIIGTPAYMAPEQGSGGKVDARCDLFSLGVVLYRMAAGVQPFLGTDTVATLLAVATTEPAAPKQLNPDLPTKLSDLVMRLLEKDPDKRIATATEVVQILQEIEHDLQRQSVSTATKSPQLAASRARPAILVGTAIAVAALFLLGVLVYQTVIIRDKDGKKIVEFKVPKDGKAEIIPDTKGVERKIVASYDHLDPKTIPESERFPWQPKELVAVLGEHRGRLWSSATRFSFSPDGKTIACCSQGFPSHGKLFDALTLRETAALSLIDDVAYLANGQLVTTSVRPPALGVLLWDMVDGQPKLRHRLTDAPIRLIAVSDNGQVLAAPADDGTVRLWDLGAQPPKERPGIKAKSARASLAPDGKMLAVTEEGSKLTKIWDLTGPTPKERGVIDNPSTWYTQAFARDGKTLAIIAGADPTVHLWDVSKQPPVLKSILKHLNGAAEAAFVPGGKLLAVKNTDLINLVDLTTLEPTIVGTIPGVFVGMAFSHDGKALATSRVDRAAVEVWDLTDRPSQRVQFEGSLAPTLQALPARDGKTLVCAHDETNLRLWDLGAPRRNASMTFAAAGALTALPSEKNSCATTDC